MLVNCVRCQHEQIKCRIYCLSLTLIIGFLSGIVAVVWCDRMPHMIVCHMISTSSIVLLRQFSIRMLLINQPCSSADQEELCQGLAGVFTFSSQIRYCKRVSRILKSFVISGWDSFIGFPWLSMIEFFLSFRRMTDPPRVCCWRRT